MRRVLTVQLLCIASLWVGCSQATRIVVEVDAERGVLEDSRYDRTHVVVTSAACEDREAGVVLDLGHNYRSGEQTWPFRVLLTPCGGDASRGYEVVVTAETEVPGSSPVTYRPFVLSRAVSGYVSGETRVLRVTLQASCRGVLDCGGDQTCRNGLCELAEVRPGTLPRYSDPAPIDAGGDTLVAPDAGGFDAALDAVASDDVWLETTDAPSGTDVGTDAPTLPRDASVDAGPVRITSVVPVLPGGLAMDDQLGWSVAIDDVGDRLVAAERGAEAMFDVHPYRDGGATAIGPLPLTSTIPSRAVAVATSGDGSYMVVGIPVFGSVGSVVHVYRRDGDGWTYEASLDAPFGTLDDRFGTSIALSRDGSVLAVGAPGRQRGGPGTAIDFGAVVLYRRTERMWALDHTVEPPLPATEVDGNMEQFGAAVALSADGTTLAVGVPGEDTGIGGIGPTPDEFLYDSGAVYVYPAVFARPTERVLIKRAVPVYGDQFGGSVALDDAGATLVVGAQGSMTGAAVVFQRTLDWAELRVLQPDTLDTGDRFGASVAISGSGRYVVVGAPLDDAAPRGLSSDPADDSVRGSGAVYLFSRDEGWTSTFLKSDGGSVGADGALGWSVDISGDGRTVIAGAPSYGVMSRGAFFVFR